MKFLLISLIVLGALVGALWLFTAWTARRVERAFPPQGRFIDVPGARLHIVDQGEGPALLLIHGLAGQLANFTYGMVELLAKDYRVIAVDRPGSGYSVRLPGASATLSAQADVMAALIDALGLQRTVVVGHSLGGAVALMLAQRHPLKVTALALVAPLTQKPDNVSAAFRGLMIHQRWLRSFVAWTLALPATLARRDAVLALVFGPGTVPRDFATRGRGLLGARPSHFIGASTDLAAIEEDIDTLVAGYAHMALRVEVLFGRGDRILQPALQGQGLVAQLPGAKLTLVDGGHMLPVTASALTAEFVRRVASP